jgi:hypothetical protein
MEQVWKIKDCNSKVYEINLPIDATVKELKSKIAEEKKANAELVAIVHEGEILEDDLQLAIKHKINMVFMICRKRLATKKTSVDTKVITPILEEKKKEEKVEKTEIEKRLESAGIIEKKQNQIRKILKSYKN